MKAILVVDDQPEVVGLLQDILSLEGYRVLTADSTGLIVRELIGEAD